MSVRAGAPGGARAPRALVEAAPAAQAAPALDAFGSTAHRPLHHVLTAGLAAADFPEPAPTSGMATMSSMPRELDTFPVTVLHGVDVPGSAGLQQKGRVVTIPAPGKQTKEFQKWFKAKSTVQINEVVEYTQITEGKMYYKNSVPKDEAAWWNYLRQVHQELYTLANTPGTFPSAVTCVDLFCVSKSPMNTITSVLRKHDKMAMLKQTTKAMHRNKATDKLEWHDFYEFFKHLWIHSTGNGSRMMTCYLIGYMMKSPEGSPYGMYNYTYNGMHNAGHHDNDY